MKRIPAAALILFLPAFIYAQFVPAFSLSGQGTYPSLVSNTESPEKKFSYSANLASSCMVNLDALPQLWFIPTVLVNYSNTAQPLNVGDDRFLFSEWLDAYVSYGLNYEFSKEWVVKARGTFRTDFSKQAANELMGLGLYDFTDSGIYAENFNKFAFDGPSISFTEGFKYIDRRFRNYNTLISGIMPGGIGTGTPNAYTKEKDNIVYSAYADGVYNPGKDGWKIALKFSYDYTAYFDQRLISGDYGALEALKRADKTAKITFSTPYTGADKSWSAFEYSFSKTFSNQNYYDTRGTNMDMTDDVFNAGYYDNFENVLKFTVSTPFPWKVFPWQVVNSQPPVITVSFIADFLNYDSRRVRDKIGDYTAAKQADNNYTLSANLNQKITDYWDWNFDINYSRYNSNMEWEALGLYNYTYLTISLGTGINF